MANVNECMTTRSGPDVTETKNEHPLALPVGTELVGDYIITRVLGAGGFGITYEARERSLDRMVAIKEYFPVDIVEREGWALVKSRSKTLEIKYARGLRRFIEEAKAITQFNHPNIVRVLRYFKSNNTAFMVLHYEEGVDMGHWRDNLARPPSQPQLEAIIKPLLDALELMHNNDFLHRDIAPDNIIIRKDGSPILIDFGSARSELTFNSKTVSALVKSGYSPFEQYAKNSKEQGPWTDIYSFASTLYQMVTGTAPPDSLSRLAKDEIVPTTKRAKKFYEHKFLAAIDAGLAVKIADRPQSIAQWRNMLFVDENQNPAALHVPISSPMVSSLKNRSRTAAFAVGTLIEKAGLKPTDMGANAARLAAKIKTPLQNLVASRNKPASPLTNISRQEDGASIVLPRIDAPSPRSLRSLLNDMDDHYKDPGPQQAIENAAAQPSDQAPVPNPPATAGETTDQATPRLPSPIWQGLKNSLGKLRLPFSLSKKLGAGLGVVAIFFAAGSTFLPELAQKIENVKTPDRFPNKRKISRPNVIARATLLRTVRAHDGAVTALRLSGNGRQLVSIGADRTIKVWNMADGSLNRSYQPHNQDIVALDVKGNRLVQADKSGNVFLYDLDTNEQLASFTVPQNAISALTFSQWGSDLVTGGPEGRLDYWEYNKGEYNARALRGEGHSRAILSLVAHKRFFVSGSHDATTKLWSRPRKRLIRTYTSHTGAINALALSPKAYRLATGSGDDRIKIWQPKSRRIRRTIRAYQEGIIGLAFAPNGKWLASGGMDGTIRIWNARKGTLVRAFEGLAGMSRSLLFSKNGKLLVSAGEDGRIRYWDWLKKQPPK